MKFWAFVGFVLLGLSVGLFVDRVLPSLIGGVGVGILAVVCISLFKD
jgi:hypothetical protein